MPSDMVPFVVTVLAGLLAILQVRESIERNKRFLEVLEEAKMVNNINICFALTWIVIWGACQRSINY